MDSIQLGEGTTPKEISDPDRYPPPPTRWSLWTKIGVGVLVLFAVVYFNPFFGSHSGRSFAVDAYVSSGHHLGFGSPTVFGRGGSKLRIDYIAKVKDGSLVIHVWPTGMPLQHSLKTIRLTHDERSHVDVVFPKTGLYRIEIDTFRNGRNYDVDYDVSWRAW